MRRRDFIMLIGGTAALSALPRAAAALDYPTRPVHWIVGFPPGAGSNIGTEAVAHAPADGYTLLLISGAQPINVTLYEHLNYNFVRDIAPVASISREPNVIVVHPSVPVTTVPEFIAYATANPGKVTMAHPATAPSSMSAVRCSR
jgi:tripartite-type tricarboxylate transporter receptor subunit TctC